MESEIVLSSHKPKNANSHQKLKEAIKKGGWHFILDSYI